MSTSTQGLDPTVDFLAGTIAGIVGLIVGFPFDTTKVRFQDPTLARRYGSTFHAIVTIVREERFIGLYKGIASPLFMAALLNGLVFASYRFLLKIQLPDLSAIPTLAQIALAGAGAGIVSSIVTAPTELVKIRQQSLLFPTTASQVALQIFRDDGIAGLFRGITPTALRDCGYGAYFATYEATCRYFASPGLPGSPNVIEEMKSGLSWPVLLLAGGLAGIAGWLFTFPFDVVKTRVQRSSHRDGIAVETEIEIETETPIPSATDSSPLLGKPILSGINPYQSTWSTIVYSYQTEGLAAFFRGLTPTLIRAIPANMATFATFEVAVRALSSSSSFKG